MLDRRIPKKTVNARKYKSICTHAQTIYDILEQKLCWPCNCGSPHIASLCLEYRNGAHAFWAGQSQDLQFHVLLSFAMQQESTPAEPPWDWRGTQISPLDSPDTRLHRDQAGPESSTQLQTATSVMVDRTASAGTISMVAASGHSLASMGIRGGFDSLQGQGTIPASQGDSSTVTMRPKRVSFALPHRTSSESQSSYHLQGLEQRKMDGFEEIEDLCNAMANVQETTCLGVLVDTNRSRHRLSVTHIAQGRNSLQTISLQDMLVSGTPLLKIERLILGVKLASTLLQLHSTRWLPEVWSARSICFRKCGDGFQTFRSSKPLITKGFLAPGCAEPLPDLLNPMTTWQVRNQSLFALGRLLIELWFGKPIDLMRTPTELGPQGQLNGLDDFAISRRLYEEIKHDAGSDYRDAVRRCIYCDFDLTSESLDSEALKEAVHAGVLSPLERHLRIFSGEKLQEILK